MSLVAILLLLSACEKQKSVPSSLRVMMSTSEIGREAGSKPVLVDATDDWSIQIQYPGSEKNWAELDVSAGNRGKGEITLSYEANDSAQKRELKLIGTCGKRVSVWKLIQSSRATEHIPSDVNECHPGNWLELPAVSETDGLWFFSHRHQVKGVQTRDWSYNWDANAKVAHWVAYPLNKALIAGTGVRTNAWSYDPILPQKYQPNLFHSYRGSWQRGHQMPSADRQVRMENERTFFYTNMTPQSGDLNEEAWAALESKVRTWSFKFDTLYVVTGCTVNNSLGTAADNNGNRVTIPGGYFKALLGYSKGGTASMVSSSTGGYTSVAFYFKNAYASASEIMSHAMTIEELEQLTGMDFFVNLPSCIGETLTRRVKTAKDEFWKNN